MLLFLLLALAVLLGVRHLNNKLEAAAAETKRRMQIEIDTCNAVKARK